ncbi:hypothetical protein NDA16_004251 [Ustilago loliicola]|nr:hypothetical protein NDA16_004251 [Ustilago loliicola]
MQKMQLQIESLLSQGLDVPTAFLFATIINRRFNRKMASQEDTDDLYADLYGGDGTGSADVVDLGDQGHEGDEHDLIGYEDETNNNDNKHNDQHKDGNNEKTDDKSNASGGGSFIPPPSSTQQQDTGLQIKGSFIPPPAASAAHSQSDVRDLTPASHNNAQQQSADGGAGHGDAQNHGYGGGSRGEGGENRAVMPHEMPEEGKMFVGGLNWDTTEESLRRYFLQFGEIGHCTIMRDNLTGRSRGFAFLNFVDPKAVNTVMVREHYLDGKVIDPKRVIPRPQGGAAHQPHHQQQHSGGNNYNNANNSGANYSSSSSSGGQKLFVGGLPASVTPVTFRQFFEQFGPLSECTCMMDRETGKPRGFGFLTYADDASLQTVLNTHPIVFDGKEVDVKRAQSKNDPQSLQIRRQQRVDGPDVNANTGYLGHGRNNQRGYDNGGGAGFGNNWGATGGGMNNMMMGGGAGFDPAAMAQMYQSMGWGAAGGQWNPMAWQQMMASMGQGGGMDMSAMMGMGGMGAMGMGGNMSPNMGGAGANAMSPTMGNAQRGGSSGPTPSCTPFDLSSAVSNGMNTFGSWDV